MLPIKIKDDVLVPYTGKKLEYSLCTRNFHVIPSANLRQKGDNCQCGAFVFYRRWTPSMAEGSKAENDNRYTTALAAAVALQSAKELGAQIFKGRLK